MSISQKFFRRDREFNRGYARGLLMMAPKYLLDTDTCIYITKQQPAHVIHKFKQLKAGSVVMSAINYGELFYGSEKSAHAKLAHAALESLIGVIPVLPVSPDAAKHYGYIRFYLEKRGEIIGNNDLWIAAHCLALKTILVTNNTREFKRIPKLHIENWV